MRALILFGSLLPKVLAGVLTSNVQTEYGPITGNARHSNGVLSYLGIPYAAPPVGDLRWTSPRAPNPWKAPIATDSIAAACWNFLPGVVTGNQSEDCLTVNVWTGAISDTERLPVMVFIYGGGFVFGGTSQSTYDGAPFAQEGVVLVTFGYRLGVFGFLALTELDGEGSNSGDFGLQDQLFALHWVRENIAAFGGDPDNVLLFGESAGAHSVGMLMSSPLATGLFNKAIMESGAWWDSNHGSIATFDAARQRGANWAMGFGSTSPPALRELPTHAIVASALYNPTTDPTITNFGPNIDNLVLTAAPATVFSQGKQLRVPLLAGWNTDEQAIFSTWALPHLTAAQFRDNLPLQFLSRTQIALSHPALYPAHDASQANASALDLIGDLVIRQQTWQAVDTQLKAGGASASAAVYAYYFTYTSEYSPQAAHTAELPFVFGTLTRNPIVGQVLPPNAADRAFSKQIMGYWTNFAKRSDPNGEGLGEWPRYGGACRGARDILELGVVIQPIDYRLDRFEYIAGFRSDDGLLPESWKSINVSSV